MSARRTLVQIGFASAIPKKMIPVPVIALVTPVHIVRYVFKSILIAAKSMEIFVKKQFNKKIWAKLTYILNRAWEI